MDMNDGGPTYNLDHLVVLGTLVRLQEPLARSIVGRLGDGRAASRAEVFAHVGAVGKSRGGRADLGAHVGDSRKTGARLLVDRRAKVLENAAGTTLSVSIIASSAPQVVRIRS